MATRAFSPQLFSFFRDLAANNTREWFAENKTRYQEHVQEPAMEFIAGFAPLLERISPNFRADARPVGGSLFRIHRDIRFSKDIVLRDTRGQSGELRLLRALGR